MVGGNGVEEIGSVSAEEGGSLLAGAWESVGLHHFNQECTLASAGLVVSPVYFYTCTYLCMSTLFTAPCTCGSTSLRNIALRYRFYA